ISRMSRRVVECEIALVRGCLKYRVAREHRQNIDLEASLHEHIASFPMMLPSYHSSTALLYDGGLLSRNLRYLRSKHLLVIIIDGSNHRNKRTDYVRSIKAAAQPDFQYC